MLKKIAIFVFIFLVVGIVFFCRSSHTVCIFSEPAIASSRTHAGIDLVKEIKYVAGKDSLWFTEDDAIYDYSFYESDGRGNVLRKICYYVDIAKSKKESRTSKRRVKEYLRLRYDVQDRIIGENFYTGEGLDNEWFTDDDILQYYILYFYADVSGSCS